MLAFLFLDKNTRFVGVDMRSVYGNGCYVQIHFVASAVPKICGESSIFYVPLQFARTQMAVCYYVLNFLRVCICSTWLFHMCRVDDVTFIVLSEEMWIFSTMWPPSTADSCYSLFLQYVKSYGCQHVHFYCKYSLLLYYLYKILVFSIPTYMARFSMLSYIIPL